MRPVDLTPLIKQVDDLLAFPLQDAVQRFSGTGHNIVEALTGDEAAPPPGHPIHIHAEDTTDTPL